MGYNVFMSDVVLDRTEILVQNYDFSCDLLYSQNTFFINKTLLFYSIFKFGLLHCNVNISN